MTDEKYNGFEQGPIRPPNEANSLLLRITRNCPWNNCTFCPVYKKRKFSLRPLDHILEDINAVHRYTQRLLSLADETGSISYESIVNAKKDLNQIEIHPFHAALSWISTGMKSIFIQDANSLIIKPQDLIKILRHLKKCFPMVQRITSYARSHTIVRISDDHMKQISDAGLNRIHIGLESGSDTVLKFVRKGCLKKDHIKAGQKVKNAGIELSEYIMPGLGGKKLSKEHALESADTLNQINPDFIRLRSFAIPNRVKQFTDISKDWFEQCTDTMIAKEIRLFLQSLERISSTIKSDHILNLFEDINGTLPGDKSKMTGVIETFLDMDPENQMIYQIGRRSGMFSSINEMNDSHKAVKIRKQCQQQGITPENVDHAIQEMLKRFI